MLSGVWVSLSVHMVSCHASIFPRGGDLSQVPTPLVMASINNDRRSEV